MKATEEGNYIRIVVLIIDSSFRMSFSGAGNSKIIVCRKNTIFPLGQCRRTIQLQLFEENYVCFPLSNLLLRGKHLLLLIKLIFGVKNIFPIAKHLLEGKTQDSPNPIMYQVEITFYPQPNMLEGKCIFSSRSIRLLSETSSSLPKNCLRKKKHQTLLEGPN